MKRDHARLEDINIGSPCSADWEAMRGNDQKRHCEECALHVHNLSAMTRADGEELLALRGAGERVCIRMELRADGTCVTAEKPREQKRPGVLTSAALAFGVGLSAACHTEEERTQKVTPQVEEAAAEPEAPDAECLQLLGSVLFVPDDSAEEESEGELEGSGECLAPEAGTILLGRMGTPVPESGEGTTGATGPQKPRTIMGSPGARSH